MALVRLTHELSPSDQAILPILRHFLTAFYAPQTHSWQIAYRTAQEVWGQARGLALGQATGELIAHTVSNRRHPFQFRDPLDLELRQMLSRDEATLLRMLEMMREDDTTQARLYVEQLFEGKTPARFVEAGLRLAQLLGAAQPPVSRCRPMLKAV